MQERGPPTRGRFRRRAGIGAGMTVLIVPTIAGAVAGWLVKSKTLDV
jgi:hypothetical protein